MLRNCNTMRVMKDEQHIWDYLIDNSICSEQTLLVATKLNGYTVDTLESVLYVLTGYESLEQIIMYKGWPREL